MHSEMIVAAYPSHLVGIIYAFSFITQDEKSSVS